MKQETIHGLFALLRKALHPEREEPKLRSLQLDWPALYRLAANQGVLAIAWDGVERAVAAGDLVQEQLPDRMLKIKWALAVEAIEKRHKRQLACLVALDAAAARQKHRKRCNQYGVYFCAPTTPPAMTRRSLLQNHGKITPK